MRLRLLLVAALGFTTAAAQPVIDGDLTDADYVFLDDNTGGPTTGFGVPTNGTNGSVLTAAYAHVDPFNGVLYLGLGGTVEANYNKLIVFLDTRAGGYNVADYGDAGAAFGCLNNLNAATAFDDGFTADYALLVERGGSPIQVFASIVEFAGTRADMTASTSYFVHNDGTPVPVDVAYGALPDQTSQNTTDIGIEISIPFSTTASSASQPVVISGSAVSVFPIIASGDCSFLSNQTISPAAAAQGNFGFGPVDFGALDDGMGNSVADPVAYTWQQSSAAEGWRMYGAPFADVPLRDYALQNHVQGVAPSVPGTGALAGGAPNVYTYDGSAYQTFGTDAEAIAPGEGVFWYHYGSNVSDRWTALPFALQTGGVDALTSQTRSVAAPAANSSAFHLLANPFAAAFDGADLSVSTGYTLSNSLFVWDPALAPSGDYAEIDRSAATPADRALGVMAGFWAEITDISGGTAAAPTFTFDAAGRTRAADGATSRAAAGVELAFALDLVEDGTARPADETARIEFRDGAGPGRDAFDAGEPPVIEGAYARLALVDEGTRFAVVAREAEPTSDVAVALGVETSGLGERAFQIRWSDALPDGWAATLRDTETGAVVDLRTAAEYAFTAGDGETGDRFVVTVSPRNAVATDAPVAEAIVRAPAPNPAAGTSAVHIEVEQPQSVRVEAYDLLGRRVATAFDGTVTGAHTASIDVSALAPGVYVVRTTGETFVASHRLTVVR